MPRSVPIKVQWVPGHKGIEKANEQAKEAAKGHSSPGQDLPEKLHTPLPSSRLALKMGHNKQVRPTVACLFTESLRYQRLHVINPKVPSANYCKIVGGLPWHQSSILIQLWMGHIQLQQHLHKIGSSTTSICLACHQHEETIQHFLLTCTAHTWHLQSMITVLRQDALNISKLLSDPTSVEYMLNYVNATKCFHPQPPPPLQSPSPPIPPSPNLPVILHPAPNPPIIHL